MGSTFKRMWSVFLHCPLWQKVSDVSSDVITQTNSRKHDWFSVIKARNCQIEFKSNTFSKVLKLPCYYNKTKQSLWKCFHISNDDVKCPETPSCNIYCSWKATGHEASKLTVLNDIAIVPLWMVFTIGGEKKEAGISKTTVWSHCIVSEEFGILKKNYYSDDPNAHCHTTVCKV